MSLPAPFSPPGRSAGKKHQAPPSPPPADEEEKGNAGAGNHLTRPDSDTIDLSGAAEGDSSPPAVSLSSSSATREPSIEDLQRELKEKREQIKRAKLRQEIARAERDLEEASRPLPALPPSHESHVPMEFKAPGSSGKTTEDHQPVSPTVNHVSGGRKVTSNITVNNFAVPPVSPTPTAAHASLGFLEAIRTADPKLAATLERVVSSPSFGNDIMARHASARALDDARKGRFVPLAMFLPATGLAATRTAEDRAAGEGKNYDAISSLLGSIVDADDVLNAERELKAAFPASRSGSKSWRHS